jgi:orotidine-5'-phosphate decarboxylase
MVQQKYRKWIERVKKERESNIVLSLDYNEVVKPSYILQKSKRILKALSPYICAVKVNRQLVLPLGLYRGVKKIINWVHVLGLPTIMDCKINDVGHTNHIIAHHYFKAGFDAITANPFVGWDDGLKPVFQLAQEVEKGVIILVYMSHKGAVDGYAQKVVDSSTNKARFQYHIFANKALDWKADGVIVGSTYPEKVSEVYHILKGKIPIYSPGVGVQGGEVDLTMNAGAEYLIIGRSILSSKNPIDSVKKYKLHTNDPLTA